MGRRYTNLLGVTVELNIYALTYAVRGDAIALLVQRVGCGLDDRVIDSLKGQASRRPLETHTASYTMGHM
jgi:hypothetical protein